MEMRKRAGLWFAAAVVACVAGWGFRERAETTQDMRTHAGPPKARVGLSNATVLLRMPREATTASPQPFHLSASMARTAVRDGELRVALPDGTAYPVRIERQFTDDTGHWNVVGRVHTPLGAQAMVLTSLVITFATTAFLLSLVFRFYGVFEDIEISTLSDDSE